MVIIVVLRKNQRNILIKKKIKMVFLFKEFIVCQKIKLNLFLIKKNLLFKMIYPKQML